MVWRHSVQNIERLQAYVDEAKQALNLHHVTVVVLRDLPPSEKLRKVIAMIDPRSLARAELRVCRDFFRLSEQERREIVAHELAHLIVGPISSMTTRMHDCSEALRAARKQGRPPTAAQRAVAAEDERVVCHLEPLLAQLLPPCDL